MDGKRLEYYTEDGDSLDLALVSSVQLVFFRGDFSGG
jgi:hypothetical protein